MRLALALAFVILAAGCRSQTNSVRIAIFRGEELTPLAQAIGAFQDEGLAVEIHEVPSSGKAMEALFGGSVEAVAGGYDHAVRLAADGRSAVSFTVLTTRSSLALVASPKSSHIRRIEDLRGATVGVSAFGSSGNFFVNLLLAQHGVPREQVNIVATGGGHSVTVASAEQGRLDAIVTLPVSFAILKARYPAMAVLADAQTVEGTREIFGVDQYPALCLMAQQRWLDEHADLAGRLARAMVRTLQWTRSHSAAELQQRLGRPQAMPQEIPGLQALIDSCSPDGRMTAGGPEAVRKALAVSDSRVSTVDLRSTYTERFLR